MPWGHILNPHADPHQPRLALLLAPASPLAAQRLCPRPSLTRKCSSLQILLPFRWELKGPLLSEGFLPSLLSFVAVTTAVLTHDLCNHHLRLVSYENGAP